MRRLKNRIKVIYYYLLLKYKYDMLPNDVGTYDLKVSPAFKDAILKIEDLDE